MEKEYITFKHFKSMITSQPFFIWNKLPKEEQEIDEQDQLHFWNEVIDEAENATYNEVSARTVQRFDKWLRDRLMRDYECVIISGSKEEQIEKTKEAMKGEKMIISPVFEYEGALAQPFAFHPKELKAYYIKYSKKTNVKDLIRPYWDFNIIQKTVQVRDIDLYLPVVKEYKKGEIELRGIDSVQPTKTSKLPFVKNAKGEITDIRIIDFCRKPELKFFTMPHFDDALKFIKESKDKKIDATKIELDYNQISQNPNKVELLKAIGFKYAEWNGNVIKMKDVIDFIETEDESLFDSPVLNYIKSINKATVVDKEEPIKEIEYLKNSKKVIWYDFEGYSLPFAPLDGVSPHQQLVFQVSVIETIDDKETRLNNVVIDPKTLNLDDLFNIIKEVYSEGADAYVVYNRGYEIPRMTEICNLLEKEGHPKAKEAREMLNVIDNNTVDLMKVFKITSRDNIPPVVLNDQCAKSSIKNIEKHISKNNIKVPRPIRQYANLEVQNGGMAMEVAIHRALGIIGDKEWEAKVKALMEYCENDVRAMIMVYDFVIGLINGTN